MFVGLTRLHILATIDYVNAVYAQSEEKKQAALKRLTVNIQDWAAILGNEWYNLFLAHTLAAGELAVGILHCRCKKQVGHCENGQRVQRALHKLVANQEMIVDFLASRFGDPEIWNRHWTHHLKCTKEYIETLKHYGHGREYREAQRKCLQLGKVMGTDLDLAISLSLARP